MGLGLCECGCGQKTKIATRSRTSIRLCKGKPQRFVNGHQGRAATPRSGSEHYMWNGGRSDYAPYVFVRATDHPRADSRGYVQEHILIAEKALGRFLPKKAEVHHGNQIKKDNRNANLVICEDHCYHMFLERRTRAFNACGHANWRKCVYCGIYSDPNDSDMYVWWRVDGKASRVYHKSCKASYDRERQSRNVRIVV